jgi:hypothetical protein
MSTVLVDAATAAKLTAPKTQVEVRTEDGTLVGVFMPRREATEADYEWAMKEITTEEIEASLKSGPGRPLADILADLRKRYGP